MNKVDSFDIFDTLLARTVLLPTDIFDIIETSFPFPNFKHLRSTAQMQSDNSMDDIYRQFQIITNSTNELIQHLREFELQTEMKHTIPIVSNLRRVKHGDILVSDMYLSHDEIMRLLHHHSINTDITLYVSAGGKANGQMWEKLIQHYRITSHTGDNYHSDIAMASRYGIPGVYTTIHGFSSIEQRLVHTNHELCTFFRRVRLMNPYQETTLEYKIYDQQIQYNIPLLLFMCKQISLILIKENRSKVLFLARDGCLIYKLFSMLYPQYQSHYMYSSRFMNKNYNNDYITYVKSIYEEHNSILFDLHGSFHSGRKLFMEVFGSLPRIFIFDLSRSENYYEGITYITEVSNTIEIFNQALHGSLIDFKDNKPIYLPSEHSLSYIRIMHQTMDTFMAYMENHTHIMENALFTDAGFWIDYYTNTVLHSDTLLNNILDHTQHTLTHLANTYQSDKGNSYECAHHYTIHYQEIISDVLQSHLCKNNLNQIALLEIGLNRSNTDSIPSLLMWNDYFYKNINITGFDINSDFARFNSVYDNIRIVIGDQSNPQDLQQLHDKTYDIIIDDGYHASAHQQISFKELWPTLHAGGYYIIEDLHYQPTNETCLKTRVLFERWAESDWIDSEYIHRDAIETIKNEIECITFYDSHSLPWGDTTKHAFVCIKKKGAQ